jgi:large subunit ribosomal protein L30
MNPELQTLNSKLLDMKKIKITLVKSPIDRPNRQKLTLQALGLNKMNSSKEVEATPQILGMVRKVEHMVTVQELS